MSVLLVRIDDQRRSMHSKTSLRRLYSLAGPREIGARE